ncbi:MAG: hypothetical protein ACLR5H_09875 [Oscillospiraceae bacterium]
MDATIRYLKAALPGKPAMYSGRTPSCPSWTGPGSPSPGTGSRRRCCCAASTRTLTFQKLEDACILLNRGVPFVATNPDWVCPTWYGSVPDCGSVCRMLATATGRKPTVIGKP